MRLAVVIERFDPEAGGAERSTAQIVAELHARGHEVTVITALPQPDEPAVAYEVRALLRGYRLGARSIAKFARLARRALGNGRFDAALSVTTTVPATILQPRSGTVRETLNRNIALRTTSTGRLKKRIAIALSAKQRTLLRLEAATLRDPGVRRIMAVSHYVRRQLQDLYDVDAGRIEVLPNAAAMPSADAEQRRRWRRSIRRAFGVAEDQVVYLFAAYNPRLKGLDTLLAATRSLIDDGHNPRLFLAGPSRYGIQHATAELGIRNHVSIIGHTRRMAQLYCAADVTVLPTYYDPASKVVIESLMMGICAITTAYNGAADLVVPGATPDAPPPGTGAHQVRGRVIAEPSDVAALAEAMRQLADPAERGRCRAACAGLDQTLSMARHVDRLEAVLAELADAGVAILARKGTRGSPSRR